MSFFNSTSKILPYINRGTYGVVMPKSNRVLFRSDIYPKIQKTQNHIDHLSNALSQRKTHGGKSFRARQISLRDQIDSSAKRLALLRSGNEIIENLMIEELIKNPVFATFQSTTCIFHVRHENTGEWLSHSCDLGSGEELERWRETLKKTDYYFHKVKKEKGNYIAYPVGFWHKDGQLDFPTRVEQERVDVTYEKYGAKSEVLNNGIIKFITTEAPYTYLPRGICIPNFNFFPGKSAEFVLDKNFKPEDQIFFNSSTLNSFFSGVCVDFENKSIAISTNTYSRDKFLSYFLRQGFCEDPLSVCSFLKAVRTPDLQKLCKILLSNNKFPKEWVLFFETIQKDGTWIINSNKEIFKLSRFLCA